MYGKGLRTFAVLAGVIGITALASRPAVAGGFGIMVEASSSPAAIKRFGQKTLDNAAILVHTVGCMGPKATVAAKAEGLVNGKRTSIALKVDPLGSDRDSEVFAIRWKCPLREIWLLQLHAESSTRTMADKKEWHATCEALVPFGGDGQPVNTTTEGNETDKRRMVEIRYIIAGKKSEEIASQLKRMSLDKRTTQTAKAGK